METDDDLGTLIKRKDHINVLRYIRVHQLRDPELVVSHGKVWLGQDLSGGGGDSLVKRAALEQICLAALDVQNHDLAERALNVLTENCGVPKESARFRRLLARCLEASGDFNGASVIYEELLKENPSNLMALKRKYCILRAQVGKEQEAVDAMNTYLEQNFSDTAAWYEFAQFRMEKLGDYKSAAYCLEEALLGSPLDAHLHCELAECYATIGGLDNLMLARKHMAQSLELDPSSRRAQIGLVMVANAYLEESASSAKKEQDEFEVQVAQELVKYGAEQVLKSYKGSSHYAAIQKLMSEYTADL